MNDLTDDELHVLSYLGEEGRELAGFAWDRSRRRTEASRLDFFCGFVAGIVMSAQMLTSLLRDRHERQE